MKEGKQVATIEIGIMNCGSNAFKSELYGNSIIVHRTISVMGTGGYKMKSEEGNIISNLCFVFLYFLFSFSFILIELMTFYNELESLYHIHSILLRFWLLKLVVD